MLFNSWQFAVLMITVFLWYWWLDLRGQKRLLLAASVLFYTAWSVPLFSLLIYSAVLDFWASRRIVRGASTGSRRGWLAVSLVGNLALLGYFKYANFFIDSMARLLTFVGLPVSAPVLDIVLPLGISFYTFQTMSYTIDVYRGHLRPMESFADYFLFVTFFPQLVAGPILRAADFLPQLAVTKRLREREVAEGLFRVALGFIKKIVIADQLAKYVTPAFLLPGQQTPLELLLAVYGFAIQIYCDFSGYSDIAIGCGRLLGFQIMKNFNQPYVSASITEFWRRWHISLSTWLRDYLYIPLGGNRRGGRRTLINLMITMLLGGLWHGAAWHFVVWGGYHGALLAVERLWRERVRVRIGVPVIVRRLATFHLVCLGWVLFRAPDLATAGTIIGRIAELRWPVSPTLSVAMLGAATIGYLAAHGLKRWVRPRLRLNWVGAMAYAAVVVGVLLVGGRQVDFIYFQF